MRMQSSNSYSPYLAQNPGLSHRASPQISTDDPDKFPRKPLMLSVQIFWMTGHSNADCTRKKLRSAGKARFSSSANSETDENKVPQSKIAAGKSQLPNPVRLAPFPWVGWECHTNLGWNEADCEEAQQKSVKTAQICETICSVQTVQAQRCHPNISSYL